MKSWSPSQLGDLFFDDIDSNGILYWYDEIKEILKPKKKR